MTLRELIDKITSIGRQLSSAEIPAYINGVDKIESIELSRMNNGSIYANINTKKEAKEVLCSKPEDSLLDKALDFIVEREEADDYICVLMLESDEGDYCMDNCQNLQKECVIRFLKHYEKSE